MNSQIKSLLILLNVCIVIVTYAISPIDLTLASQPVRKLDLAAITQMPADTVALPDTTVVIDKREVDTIPQRFLFVGDSMVEPIAHHFWNYAQANGHQLYTVTWYSSTSYSWSGTKTLDHFIQEVKPTYVVLCMGSNELFTKDMNRVSKNMTMIKEKLGSLPYIFIGPPNWKPDHGYNDQIIKEVGADRFFDSREMQMERGRDHIHPTMKGAEVWMNQIAQWMNSDMCQHPVQMNQPTEKSFIQNLTVMQSKDKGY